MNEQAVQEAIEFARELDQFIRLHMGQEDAPLRAGSACNLAKTKLIYERLKQLDEEQAVDLFIALARYFFDVP